MIFDKEETVLSEEKSNERNFSRTSYVYIHLSIYIFNIFTAQLLIFTR